MVGIWVVIIAIHCDGERSVDAGNHHKMALQWPQSESFCRLSMTWTRKSDKAIAAPFVLCGGSSKHTIVSQINDTISMTHPYVGLPIDLLRQEIRKSGS